MRTKVLLASGVGAGMLLLFVGGWGSSVQPDGSPDGRPLSGLTTQQRAAFEAGLEGFEEVENFEDGLGPVFNGRSCAECHAQPVVGGSSPDLVNARETRIGTLRNGVFDPLVELGGTVLQRRSIQEVRPDLTMSGETVPRQATLVSRRITTPLFGAGFIEAVQDGEILSHADPNDRDRDGISGRPNMVANPESGRTEIGRFGWKADVSTLHLFSGIAYLNEMGITSPSFPTENLPQGQAIPRGYDPVPGLEDDGADVSGFADFMRLLAPLARRSPTTTRTGEGLFAQVGCVGCHTPVLATGASPIQALRFQRAELYSDLLLHDMGSGLADGMVQGTATGSEFRTAPLWGLSRRLFFLHDGRARTVQDAVLAHGGEATGARTRYQALSTTQRDALVAFLKSL
jgi:CxxC motif-containing protein (DUF1111 family)